jgi:ketoreductase
MERTTMTQTRRAALVTGFTSGIGLAVTEALAGEGIAVVGCARNAENVTTVTKRLRQEGLDVTGVAADVTSPEQVRAAVAAVVESHGRVDICVNNAGRGGGGETATLDEALWHDILEVNLTGVFRVSKEVLSTGRMLAGDYGRIINIASTGGKQGVALAAPYSASKAGVIGFTKAVALELAATGITVNAVCPGYVETPMAERVRQGYARHWGISEDEVLGRFQAKIPQGRYATAEEVAGMVTYLVSDRAASITAQAINVCGGLGRY